MLGPRHKPLLRAFLEGRTQGRASVQLAVEFEAARSALPSIAPVLEGMDVSVALRSLGFRRDYEAPTAVIVYRRAASR